jgi:L-lactate dehydrogenase complex protein LldF
MATQPLAFYERVEQAVGDADLQTALDRATSRFVTLRQGSFSNVIASDDLRDLARSIRAKALLHLDEYLVRLADRVEANGGNVFWASDGAAARSYILELARTRGVKRVVKSKSMASEEIHLNQALEAERFEVIETDLGEYIIQLAGETPSHLIAPAIHKTREQVSQLFHEHLGIPLTDDIPTLAATARRVLRQGFLTAEMGISGVNFAVADEGAVCMVTNEGNGRLSSTVPRVHVAIMGMERIVASLDELMVMLQVLARSATGQKISVYTNLLAGPARPGEPDGPDEFHLVILDNGRSGILSNPDYVESLFCIRCGACLNACPVYREIGGHAYGSVYSGPIGAVLTPLLDGLAGHTNLPYASSLCGACQEVCPVRINIPDMLLRLRRDSVRQRLGTKPGEREAMRAWRATMLNPRLYRLGGKAASLGTRLLARGGRIRRLPPPLSGWTRRRDFPAFARKSFRERWDERQQAEMKLRGLDEAHP